MEPPLFLFLVGWIGAAVIGFALTAARVSLISVWPALGSHLRLSTATESQAVSEPLRTSSLQEIRLSTIPAVAHVSARPLAIATGPPISSSLPSATSSSLSCPTCGLQAPEKLMREHFLGSPLHEYRTSNASSVSPVTLASAVSQPQAVSVEEENDRTSLGDLLQTLNVMERLLKRDFYRHELRIRSGISARVANIG